MGSEWSVQDAKAKLSEVMRRARTGEAQYIGADDPCVVVSAKVWERALRHEGEPVGSWLVRNAPRAGSTPQPSRRSKRQTPFSDEPS